MAENGGKKAAVATKQGPGRKKGKKLSTVLTFTQWSIWILLITFFIFTTTLFSSSGLSVSLGIASFHRL